MKTRIILLLFGLMSIAFSSCNMTSSSADTPQIIVAIPSSNRVDTLNTYITDVSGVYRMDTINVGDTVTFRIIFYGYSNNLLSCNVIQSDTSSTKIILPNENSLDSIFSSTSSNYATGKFIVKDKVTSIYLPFKYIAKKASKDAQISFYVSSDATFNDAQGTNTASFVLKTPIKAKE
jgi:hypothetical protein